MITYNYRFSIGQKVKIRGSATASIRCKENKDRVVTIKEICSFTRAYELEELDGLWMENCFVPV